MILLSHLWTGSHRRVFEEVGPVTSGTERLWETVPSIQLDSEWDNGRQDNEWQWDSNSETVRTSETVRKWVSAIQCDGVRHWETVRNSEREWWSKR